MVKLYKCSGCEAISYCGIECQTTHWPVHKRYCKAHRALWSDNAFDLFEQMATARDSEALFEDFLSFMTVHTLDGTLADTMEDYLDGFFKKETELRIMLRSIFRENGLEWNPSAWGLYLEWEQHKEGDMDTAEKMLEFTEEVRPLF